MSAIREYLDAVSEDWSPSQSLKAKLEDHKAHCRAKPGNCPFEKKAEATLKEMDDDDIVNQNDDGNDDDTIPQSVLSDTRAGTAVSYMDKAVPSWRDDARSDAGVDDDEFSDSDLDDILETVFPTNGKVTTLEVLGEVVDEINGNKMSEEDHARRLKEFYAG